MVQDRWREERERMRAETRVLHTAQAVVARYATVSDAVPESERRGKGARLTATDLAGADRVLAVAIARAEAAAAPDRADRGIEHVRGVILQAMCQREAEGEHADNLLLIHQARPPREGGHIGSGR